MQNEESKLHKEDLASKKYSPQIQQEQSMSQVPQSVKHADTHSTTLYQQFLFP
jgi:hypothetical protein